MPQGPKPIAGPQLVDPLDEQRRQRSGVADHQRLTDVGTARLAGGLGAPTRQETGHLLREESPRVHADDVDPRDRIIRRHLTTEGELREAHAVGRFAGAEATLSDGDERIQCAMRREEAPPQDHRVRFVGARSNVLEEDVDRLDHQRHREAVAVTGHRQPHVRAVLAHRLQGRRHHRPHVIGVARPDPRIAGARGHLDGEAPGTDHGGDRATTGGVELELTGPGLAAPAGLDGGDLAGQAAGPGGGDGRGPRGRELADQDAGRGLVLVPDDPGHRRELSGGRPLGDRHLLFAEERRRRRSLPQRLHHAPLGRELIDARDRRGLRR